MPLLALCLYLFMPYSPMLRWIVWLLDCSRINKICWSPCWDICVRLASDIGLPIISCTCSSFLSELCVFALFVIWYKSLHTWLLVECYWIGMLDRVHATQYIMMDRVGVPTYMLWSLVCALWCCPPLWLVYVVFGYHFIFVDLSSRGLFACFYSRNVFITSFNESIYYFSPIFLLLLLLFFLLFLCL